MMVGTSNPKGGVIIMWPCIEPLLSRFRPCFSRSGAYLWFLIIIAGFIIRLDHLGASSFIRWLFLAPDCYELMLRFFRAGSWSLKHLMSVWAGMCVSLFPPIDFNGRRVLIGDSTKVSKEAEKMPGVKVLHQESENSGKSEYIRGHHFGFICLLVGSLRTALALPLQGELHEGVEQIRPGLPFAGKLATLITRMAHLGLEKARQIACPCYLVLDAYYSVGPVFRILRDALDDQGQRLVHVIVRAKSNYVAYMCHQAPNKKTEEDKKVPLREIFDFPKMFTEGKLNLYGEAKIIRYCCVDLFWKPVGEVIRFVCVIDGDKRFILMCSDLDLAPTEIITIYSYRFKIEVMFLALKHLLGAFCYHFWTKSLPRLGKVKDFDYSRLTPAELAKCDLAIEAIERFVNLCAITLGLLQYLALTMSSKVWQNYRGWLRTYPAELPSERVVQSVLQAEFFSPAKVRDSRTLRLLRARAAEPSLDLAS
jgi:hypothetical protein